MKTIKRNYETSLTNAQRIKLLQQSSAIARMEIEAASLELKTALDHRTILRRFAGQAGGVVGSILGVGGVAGGAEALGVNLSTARRLLPYVSTATGYMKKKGLRTTLLLGGAAFIAALLAKKYLGDPVAADLDPDL